MIKKLLVLLLLSPISMAQFESSEIFDSAAPKAHEAFLKIKSNPKSDSVLKLFSTTFEKDFDDTLQFKTIQEKHFDLYEMDLFAARNKQMSFVSKIEKEKILDPETITLLKNTVRFQYWHGVFFHAITLSNLKTNQNKVISLPEIVLQDLDKIIIKDERLMIVAPYRKFLMNYITYFNSKNNKFQKYSDQSKAAIDKFYFANNTFQGEAVQYFIVSHLNTFCDLIRPSIIKTLISNLNEKPRIDVLKRCENALAKNEEEMIAAMDKSTPDDWGMVGVDDKNLALKKFKGKYVYVDIWASWCGPCRAEFPHSRAMMEKLTEKQRKKVEFLFISIDDQPETWKATLDKMKLGGTHAWVKGAWGAKLLHKLNVSSIPRYILLDPSGKIIQDKANRPSSPETFQEILKLIGE